MYPYTYDVYSSICTCILASNTADNPSSLVSSLFFVSASLSTEARSVAETENHKMKASQLAVLSLLWAPASKIQAQIVNENWLDDFLDNIDFGNNNNGNSNNNGNNGGDFNTNLDLDAIDAKLNEKMSYVLDLAGLNSDQPVKLNMIYDSNMASASERQTQGKRVFDCLGDIGNFNEASLPKFESLRTMLYGQFFDVYETTENINVICAAAQRRRHRRDRRLEKQTVGKPGDGRARVGLGSSARFPGTGKSHKHRTTRGSKRRRLNLDRSKHHRNRRRKLQMNQANYPSEISTAYQDWAEENVQEFIESGDLTDRPSPELLVEEILDPLAIASTAYTALLIAEAAVEVVCNVVGIVEFGFDPGDFCRIISSAIGVAAWLQSFVVAMYEADFENWEFHTFLLDSAEIEAIYLGS